MGSCCAIAPVDSRRSQKRQTLCCYLLVLIPDVLLLPMPRQSRQLQPGYCYHITTRCNNREFRLTRLECRQVFLYAIKKAQDKYRFKLYALCIMSNHVHYLMEPDRSEDLPKIMHWLNWYTAMCFNRMLNRTEAGISRARYRKARNGAASWNFP